jgi:hypothetical protein
MNSLSNLTVITEKLAVRTLAVALILSSASPIAFAEDDKKFSLSLGVFITDRDSYTSIGVSGDPTGTPVDLEGDLGLDTSDTVFRIDGYYRFNDKHRIDVSAFDLSRTSTKTIEKEIDWNDTIFPIDTSVSGDFDLNIYKLAYTYTFMRRDKGYLGASAGLYIADIGTRISAPNIADRAGGSVTAPLPVVGLRGEYRISDKWSFRASGEFFALEYQDFDGSLIDLYAGVDYQLFERAAIGVGINSVTIDLGIESTQLNGELDWRYDGGLLFLKVDF